MVVVSCTTTNKKEEANEDIAALDSGEVLAKTYCGSCHLFPSPDLLDKNTWIDHALPAMGYRFGIYKERTRDSLIEKGIGGRIVQEANIFPSRQIISNHHWEQIRKYYFDHAPNQLSVSDDSPFSTSKLFSPVVPDFQITRAAISAITYDADKRQLYVADCSRDSYSSVTILDTSFKPVASLGLPHPVSNLTIRSDTLYILMMGHFVPSDEPAGQLIKAIKNKKGDYEGYSQVLKGLKRPVDVAYADLDEDGDDDIVVCEFGNHTGSVSLFLRERNNKYTRRILLDAPGAARVVVEDLNGDKKNDILVLMAQGDEGVDIYFNQGNGQFNRERVLRFPAVYGSTSFSLTDMNNDGFKDIAYVNGDNADASQIIKPYHGIRIFLNDRQNGFTESYFFPLPGAYKAIPADFDNDGDIDVAAISFFPDFVNHPERGFAYLENITANDTLAFTPSFVGDTERARWITFTHGDVDGDNDQDLILGSFTSLDITGDTTGAMRKKFLNNPNALLLLRNDAKH